LRAIGLSEWLLFARRIEMWNIDDSRELSSLQNFLFECKAFILLELKLLTSNFAIID
jgi:hypothetical protein